MAKGDGVYDFDATDLLKLKPCPHCGGKLEYWDKDLVACSGDKCNFRQAIAKGNSDYATRVEKL